MAVIVLSNLIMKAKQSSSLALPTHIDAEGEHSTSPGVAVGGEHLSPIQRLGL